MSQQLAGKQVPVSEKLVPPQRIDAAGTRRALFSSEMTSSGTCWFSADVGWVLQSDMPLVQGC